MSIRPARAVPAICQPASLTSLMETSFHLQLLASHKHTCDKASSKNFTRLFLKQELVVFYLAMSCVIHQQSYKIHHFAVIHYVLRQTSSRCKSLARRKLATLPLLLQKPATMIQNQIQKMPSHVLGFLSGI